MARVIRGMKLVPDMLVAMCSEVGAWTTDRNKLPEDATCEGVTYDHKTNTFTLLISSESFKPDDPDLLEPTGFIRYE